MSSWSANSDDDPLHHISHRKLLTSAPIGEQFQEPVDALVVPTSRTISDLGNAFRLARDLDCVLLALCSGSVTAAEVASSGTRKRVRVIAIDVAHHSHQLPRSRITETLKGTAFERPSDTSVKRNLALAFGRIVGWRRLFFLDDDIRGVDPEHVLSASYWTGMFDAVGMHNRGYPDNSVVCHAYRHLGPGNAPAEGDQDQFVGAGALLVDPRANRSHFPNIYNQDWLFMLGHGLLRSSEHRRRPNVAVVGEMRQRSYDPYADADRARREELGDCFAEGLYWLLDENRSLDEAASGRHWDEFLDRRRTFIELLLKRLVDEVEPANRDKMEAALEQARRMHPAGEASDRKPRDVIKPELCVDLMRAWRRDLTDWRSFVAMLPVDRGLRGALEYLGSSAGVEISKRPWPKPFGDRLGWLDAMGGRVVSQRPAKPSQLTPVSDRRRGLRWRLSR